MLTPYIAIVHFIFITPILLSSIIVGHTSLPYNNIGTNDAEVRCFEEHFHDEFCKEEQVQAHSDNTASAMMWCVNL
jgi:hypothetical protein